MGIGSFAMACLLLAAGAGAPAEEWHMNQTQFKIPISIKPELQADISELRLFCSRDEGKTWNQAGVAKPTQDAFLFTTKDDGKYWFKVAVVHNGVQEPLDMYSGPVGQKIVVDTKPPEVRVAAERQGDVVVAGWEINELYPRPETLKVEYRTPDAPEGFWNAVPHAPGQNKVTFRPDNPAAALVVRVQIEDKAGNPGSGVATVAGTAPPVIQTALQPPPPPAPPPSVVTKQDVPAAPTGTGGIPGQPFNPVPQPRPADTNVAVTPTGFPAPTYPGSFTTNPTLASPALSMHGALPALQLVNKTQVRLDYEVAKLGPSGVGSVDVYVTTDEGQTWQSCQVEAVPGMPVNDQQTARMRGGVLIHLPKDEVVYGYQMVVRSGAGLGKPPPRPGDPPQIRIERDTTPPTARWLKPMPDPNHRDTLLLVWEASDKNLPANPVTLEWGATKDGPWNVIGQSQLPNTGRYTWAVPPMQTPGVYLRLTVRDSAGNITVVTTEQPEIVDLCVPEVTITGVGNSTR